MNPSRLSIAMIEYLHYYVYIYINPTDNKIFYLAGSRGREDRILQGADESYPLRDYFHPAQIDLI
jgi:hypothetical protein